MFAFINMSIIVYPIVTYKNAAMAAIARSDSLLKLFETMTTDHVDFHDLPLNHFSSYEHCMFAHFVLA